MKAFSLVEVLVASTLMAIVTLSLLSATMQSRRMTEGSILQIAALNVVQGYIEQMKSIDYVMLKNSEPSGTVEIITRLDHDSEDGINEEKKLTLSNGEAPTTLPALGTSPTGAVDNVLPDVYISTPATSPNDKLTITLWVWVKDLTGSIAAIDKAKSIHVIYTYEYLDGGRKRTYRRQLRSIRSEVPTY